MCWGSECILNWSAMLFKINFNYNSLFIIIIIIIYVVLVEISHFSKIIFYIVRPTLASRISIPLRFWISRYWFQMDNFSLWSYLIRILFCIFIFLLYWHIRINILLVYVINIVIFFIRNFVTWPRKKLSKMNWILWAFYGRLTMGCSLFEIL